MAFFEAIARVREKNGSKTVFGEPVSITQAMKLALLEWQELFYAGGSERPALTVVSQIYAAVCGDATLQVMDPDETNDTEDDQREALLARLTERWPDILQYLLAAGELFVKVQPVNNLLEYSAVPHFNYDVLHRDATGEPDDVVLYLDTQDGDRYYTLHERRYRAGVTVQNEDGTESEVGVLHIDYKLTESYEQKLLGAEVPLSKKYPELQPSNIVPGVSGLGMVWVKLPVINSVDGSPDGVSIYSPAADEIRRLCRQDERSDREYLLTEPRVIVHEDAADVDMYQDLETGEIKSRSIQLPDFLYPLQGSDNSQPITVYNPIPNQEQLAGKTNEIKRNIENIIGLRPGLLADVQLEQRTATEVRANTDRYAALTESLKRTCDGLLQQLTIATFEWGAFVDGPVLSENAELSMAWGNGVLYDADKDFARLQDMVDNYGLDPAYLLEWLEIKALTPEQIQEIRQEYGLIDAQTSPGVLEALGMSGV